MRQLISLFRQVHAKNHFIRLLSFPSGKVLPIRSMKSHISFRSKMTTTENQILPMAIETYRHYAGQPTLSDIESCRQDSQDELLHLTPYFSTMDLVKLEDSTY